jgi:glyceraldehyde 3-phosphate dehydrogenase
VSRRPRLAINGLGRMGKLLLRALLAKGRLQHVALLNDVAGDPGGHAHLLEFDTVHGRWRTEIGWDEAGLTVAGHRMRLTRTGRMDELPLRELEIDLAVDCTGAFKSPPKLQPYYEAGVRKVVVSAPVKEAPALNVVYGVNHGLYRPAEHHLVTAASCTTNCLAPVVKVLHEEIGVLRGSMTTIHNPTNTQTIVDKPHKDVRRARSALNSLIPTSTGSATAIGLIFPELKGRLDGHAVRAPLLNASLTDCAFELRRPTTRDELNGLFRRWSEGPLAGVLGYEERPLVSADYVGDPRSAIVDAASTLVVDRTHAKIYAWYDNEWGYANRLADVTLMVADGMAGA